MTKNKDTKKEKPKLPDKPPIETLDIELGEKIETTTNKPIKKENPKLQKETSKVKVKMKVPLDKEKTVKQSNQKH